MGRIMFLRCFNMAEALLKKITKELGRKTEAQDSIDGGMI